MRPCRSLFIALLWPQLAGAQSAVCAPCHREIAERFARTPMARSFGSMSGIMSAMPDARFEHKASEETFSIYRRDGAEYVKREQAGGANTLERKIDYRFGSGNHARSFISRTARGELLEIPITWYAENGGSWGMSPGYDTARHSGFSRKLTYRCMFCHNAYPTVPEGADRRDGTVFPAELPQGIDCQRCHGSGEAHLKGAPMAAVRQLDVCLQCHLETTNMSLPASLLRYDRPVFSYRPGEPLADYMLAFDHAPGSAFEDKFEFASAPYRLFRSACYRASAGRLTCTTCHDPHGAGRDPAASCRTCHAAELQAMVAEARHPASPDCVGCHMPSRRPSDAAHVTVTDHFIRRRPDGDATARALEHNSSNTPPYRGAVSLYYPPKLPPNSPDELYVAVAQVRNQANLRDGIASLAAAIAKYKPARAEFYLDLAEAYRHAGDFAKAIALYREASARDPKDWRSFHGLGVALAAAGDTKAALTALQRAAALEPRETAIAESLGTLLLRLGRLPEAVAVFRAGIATDPDAADLRNDLGTALLRTGDAAGAEAALREAVRLRPELPAMHINLAEVLARGNRFAAAQREFEQALRLDAESAPAHSAYATALAGNGRMNEARREFETAIRLDGKLANTHNNLGTVLRQLGDTAGAIREYRAAIALQPEFATAHHNLGVALGSDTSEAREHLQKAAALRKIAP